jgi:hypothetical protein
VSRSTGWSRSTWRPRTSSRTLDRAPRCTGLKTIGILSALGLSFALPVAAGASTQPPPTSTATSAPGGSAPTMPALVELTDLSPLDAAAGDAVTFDGTVTNRSEEDLTVLNAYLRLSRIPMLDRADLARLADPDFRPGARQSAFVLAADALTPGQSATFRLTVPAAELRLVEPGVYAAGIEVLATRADGSRGVVGRVMTALPWMPAHAAIAPIGVALAWPVTAPVDRASDGGYLTDDLGQAFASGGRLSALLNTSLTAEVTWLVDPAVVEAAADLADGYQVRADPVDPTSATPGTRGLAAATWLEQVRRLAAAGRVTLTPYADVDAVALVRAGLGDDAVAALDLTAQAAQTLGVDRADGPTELFRPPGGTLDLPTAERLVAAGVTTVLLDARGVSTDGDAPTARLDVGGTVLTAILVDEALRDLFTAPPSTHDSSARATELSARQLLLAHTALAAIAAPSDTGYVGQTVLVVSGDESSTISPDSVLDALDQDVPWMQQAPLQAVRASPMVDAELTYPEDALASELPAAYVARVSTLEQQASLLSALTAGALTGSGDEPSAGLEGLTAARLRLTSAAWRPEPGRAASVVAEAGQAMDTQLGRVHLLDGGSITLSSQTGRFPLTVVNDLAVPVTVQLVLVSHSPARLRVPTVTPVEVQAGARTTVDVSAEANANGDYVVDARLATTDGGEFGTASTLTIRATDYDTVAWIVMGAAGGLLLIGSARRITRRVRDARATPVPAAAAPAATPADVP